MAKYLKSLHNQRSRLHYFHCAAANVDYTGFLLFYNDFLFLQSPAIGAYAPQDIAARCKAIAAIWHKGIRTNRQEFSLQIVDCCMVKDARLTCHYALRQARLHHFTDILLQPREAIV